jgi:hypothetical protein
MLWSTYLLETTIAELLTEILIFLCPQSQEWRNRLLPKIGVSRFLKLAKVAHTDLYATFKEACLMFTQSEGLRKRARKIHACLGGPVPDAPRHGARHGHAR